MKLKYGLISKERCDEIDSWKIKDPYGYGDKLSTHGNYWVYNEDESILFCHAFMPRHDDRETNHETYLYVNGKQTYFINYIVDDVKTEDDDKEWFVTVTIMRCSAFSIKDKNILSILKAVISVFIQKHRREMPGETFVFKFFYDGEEI